MIGRSTAWLLSLGTVLLASCAWGETPANASEQKEVISALENMAQAMVNKDVTTLGKIIHPDVMFGHSSGRLQTKAEVLKDASGAGVVESMKFSEMKVQVSGNLAMARGTLDLRQGRDAKSMTDNHLVSLWVLVKTPQGWQVIARQPTRPRE